MVETFPNYLSLLNRAIRVPDTSPFKDGHTGPTGGITIAAAGRKYHIAHTIIWHWVQKGYVPVLLRTKRGIFIDEIIAARLVEVYQRSPKHGKSRVRRIATVS